MQRTDLGMRTDKRARQLAIADNRVAELDLDWNNGVLRELDIDLSQFWNDAELRSLIGQELEEAPEPQMDRAAELQQKWGTARGQIWEIGKHRVICGDSTSSEDITLLMGTDRAQCMWTDPPRTTAKPAYLRFSGQKPQRSGPAVAKLTPDASQ